MRVLRVCMDKDNIYLKMEINMRVILKADIFMVKENQSKQMVMYIQEIGWTVCLMENAKFTIKMIMLHMKEIAQILWVMEKGN